MEDKKTWGVVVADDYRLSRSFFEMYVKSSARYELLRSFARAEDAAEYCQNEKVDLVILDVLMRSGIDGLTAAERIKQARPDIKLILTTSMAESRWEERARSIGAESFWYKEYSEESLLDVMDRTMAGQSVYPGGTPQVRFGRAARGAITPRELDVLRELTRSRTNEEIGEALGMSVNTVRTHIQNMLSKTGFSNRLELAINAKATGIVVSDETLRSSEGRKEDSP